LSKLIRRNREIDFGVWRVVFYRVARVGGPSLGGNTQRMEERPLYGPSVSVSRGNQIKRGGEGKKQKKREGGGTGAGT